MTNGLNIDPPPAADVIKYFQRTNIDGTNSPVPAGTFEIGLVLGGTGSVGAYTAGVMDFLIEALDIWEDMRNHGNASAPGHKVVIKAITGTSGGGVNASIAARALAYDFPHVTRATTIPTPNPETGVATLNPFYDTWINLLDFSAFLTADDIASSGKVAALLNGDPIKRGAASLISYGTGDTERTYRARGYVATPLNVILTVTNTRGVPYRMEFGGGLGETYVDHADHGRFAVVYPGHAPLTTANLRPDEFVLGFDGVKLPQQENWTVLGSYALGTAAIPVGLPAVPLARPTLDYCYRVTVVPSDTPGRSPEIVPLVPDWNALRSKDQSVVPLNYAFMAVDGGATDNEPIELARVELAGADGRNPRSGITADRAVVLVDPFAGGADLGPEFTDQVTDQLGPVVNTMLQQTRYDSSDIKLALDQTQFSRFMISATRTDTVGNRLVGDKAVAGTGLFATVGFASAKFRRHDYMLGRANCQEFLRKEFLLPSNANLFATSWNLVPPNEKAALTVTDTAGNTFLPIIPLLGEAAIGEEPEGWPKYAFDPEEGNFRDLIETRFKAIVENELTGALSGLGAWIAANATEGWVADKIVALFRSTLVDWDLLDPKPPA
jgi:hypothetical protein